MIRLTEIPDIDVKEKVGTKAVRLAKIQAAGLPVKKALIIEVEEVKNILQSQQVLPELLEVITRSLDFGSVGVAVRSSALGETGEDSFFSWAGQFKTRLFVQTNELTEAILECANAQKNESVKAYAKSQGIEIPPLALIVQEMVPAVLSGILFTINPVNPNDQTMVIEMVEGVGESLASGKREPRRYYINRDSGVIIKEEGSSLSALSDNKIKKLIEYGLRLREMFGADQDIEWAIDRDGQIFINQSRDITVVNTNDLENLRQQVVKILKTETDRELLRLSKLGLSISHTVYSDQNIAELLTPHPVVMSLDLFTYCFAHGDGAIRRGRNDMGYEIGKELDTGFFTLIGGQPRCSIVHDALTYRIRGIPLTDYAKLIEYYLSRIEKDQSLANYPEIVLYEQRPSRDLLISLFGNEKADRYLECYNRFFNNIYLLEDLLAEKTKRQFLPRWKAEMNKRYLQISNISSMDELASFFQDTIDALRIHACYTFVCVARLGFFAYARLRQHLERLFSKDGANYLDILTSGLNIDQNPNLMFNVDLAQLLDGKVNIEKVLTEYGHLSQHELEISTPRYRENPEILRQLAKKILGDPLEELKKSQQNYSNTLEQLKKNTSLTDTAELIRDVTVARTYLALREVVKFELLKAYDLARQSLLKIEAVLGWEDGLIFHLFLEEIFNGRSLRGKKRIAQARRDEYEKNIALYIPPVLDSRNLDLIGKPPTASDRILNGIGVTNKVTEGEVVVLLNLQDQESLKLLQEGKILVTVTTDPAWSPVIASVGKGGGLVTEIGGLLAHGAIYAREMGIAAVLNVPQATKILKTGMRIRVNGPQGYVEILKS